MSKIIDLHFKHSNNLSSIDHSTIILKNLQKKDKCLQIGSNVLPCRWSFDKKQTMSFIKQDKTSEGHFNSLLNSLLLEEKKRRKINLKKSVDVIRQNISLVKIKKNNEFCLAKNRINFLKIFSSQTNSNFNNKYRIKFPNCKKIRSFMEKIKKKKINDLNCIKNFRYLDNSEKKKGKSFNSNISEASLVNLEPKWKKNLFKKKNYSFDNEYIQNKLKNENYYHFQKIKSINILSNKRKPKLLTKYNNIYI